MSKQGPGGSIIDPYYSSGQFIGTSTSGRQDAEFKVLQLEALLAQFKPSPTDLKFQRIADVGCGNGDSTLLLLDMFRSKGLSVEIDGFDIHPHISKIKGNDAVRFFREDFCSLELDQLYDLVVLFDVIEHVPDPIGFLKAVALRSKAIALHIPLDDFALGWMRQLPRSNLSHPGHLVALDASSSINLLAFAGLRTRDFLFTPAFRAPTGRDTKLQKLLAPMRAIIYSISPYLLHRTIGGVSLMVLASTPLGLE